MEDSFVDKIKQIVLDHLDDEKFGVKELSSKIGLSKSQAFRKVKSLTNKSINQLIRETRLEEAAKLILESNLHASEITYKVGFSSPSYFNKCFSKYYGITPGEYKEKYKDNLPINGFDQKTSPSGVKKFQTIFYILGAAILLFVLISVIKSKSSITSSNSARISIAVLYYDDHSSESDKEWFCSAITEEITAKLTRIKRLIVIGRTSVKQYRNSNQSIPEIAEALGVDYVIEGSVATDSNKVKITTQLIRANNEHIWHKEYTHSFDDLFIIQQNVAKQIVEQLKIDLSLEEEKRLNYVSTQNLEAFQLVSEGRSFADLAGVDYLERVPVLLPNGYKNLRKSDSLFRKALELDPKYAEAYAELAYSLHLRWGDIKLIDSLLNKSLEIDPETVQAYTTKGAIMATRKGNWKMAKTYFDKALEIMPNDATNQLYIAFYFANRPEPDYKKAFEHINIAQKLNPRSYQINSNKIEYLLMLDKLSDAEEFYKSNNAFFPDNLKSKIQIFFIKARAKKVVMEKKDWNLAIDFYHKEIKKDSLNAELYRLLAEAYDEILNDAPNFLKYADKALKLDSVAYIFKRSYAFALAKNKKYEDVLNYIKLKLSKYSFFNFYYYQGKYDKAEPFMHAYPFANNINQALLYASQGKLENTYKIINKGVLANFEKAKVFAILKERDSMYYYINKEKDIYKIRYFNSYFEVDPYRKEERFKALLRRHYLPLTHWNESEAYN
jgi:TolB-like protein/AraC-like DNA-binding protein/Tfp pilus assembly protein PilF